MCNKKYGNKLDWSSTYCPDTVKQKEVNVPTVHFDCIIYVAQ